jgi:hypothetical protein
VVAFHEFDLDGAMSHPFYPLLEATLQRIREAFIRAGIDARTGLRLGRIFEEAGLPSPTMILGARIERGPEAQVCEQVTQVTRTLLPLMQRTGVATIDEVDIDTLAARLRDEIVGRDATAVSPSFIGAWARTGQVDPNPA